MAREAEIRRHHEDRRQGPCEGCDLLAALDAERASHEQTRRERDAARAGETRAVLDRDHAISAQARANLGADQAERERDEARACAMDAKLRLRAILTDPDPALHTDANLLRARIADVECVTALTYMDGSPYPSALAALHEELAAHAKCIEPERDYAASGADRAWRDCGTCLGCDIKRIISEPAAALADQMHARVRAETLRWAHGMVCMRVSGGTAEIAINFLDIMTKMAAEKAGLSIKEIDARLAARAATEEAQDADEEDGA